MKRTVRLLSFLLLLNLFLAIGAWEGLRQDALVEPIASQVLRFRVLANSNTPEDQSLKLAVRDTILETLARDVPETAGVQEMENWILAHQNELVRQAEETVRGAGYSYPVSLTIGDVYFPEKTYGSLTFPRGTYRALMVELGRGRGRNWWCVLYPSLCFTDAISAQVTPESQEKLENTLTEEECQILEGQTEVRFALFDWLGSLFR